MLKKFSEFINETTSFNDEELKFWIVNSIAEWLDHYDSLERYLIGLPSTKQCNFEKSILVWIADLEDKIIYNNELTKNDLISIIIYLRDWFDTEDNFGYNDDEYDYKQSPSSLFEYEGLSEEELEKVIIEIYNYINDTPDSYLRPAVNMGLL